MTPSATRHRQRADAIEYRHQQAAEVAINRRGRDRIIDDLARGQMTGSLAFKDALRVAAMSPDGERPSWQRRFGLRPAMVVLFVTLIAAVIAWARPLGL